MEQFTSILMLFCGAVVLVSLCRKLQLPPIIGYLWVGILLGPGGLKWIPSTESMHFLAEFGIVFLMFTLGLEFSIPHLISSKRALLVVGSCQVVLCLLIAFALGLLFGLEVRFALIVAAALSLSSTAVVIKQLSEQKEKHTSHGQLAINILLLQDIAAVLFLILVPAMAGGKNDPLYYTLILTFTKGVAVCLIMGFIGLRILRPLFHLVARAHSTELFMLASLLVALTAAWITSYLGLSMALGAFIAGLMLGETEFKYQLEQDIQPFRDVLLGLFFIIIGAYLELSKLPENGPLILALLLSIISGKTLLIMIVAYVLGGISQRSAFKTGLILAHGGEFGFVILTLAIQEKLIPYEHRATLFSSLVLSVMFAPMFIRHQYQIARWFFHSKKETLYEKKEYVPYELIQHAAELSNHVIICGFGRVGQILARFLEQEHITWLALDLDPLRISKSSLAGEHSFYGDATNPKTLAAAGLSRARKVVLTFGEPCATAEALRHIRNLRLDVPVFIRTIDESNLEKLLEAGATEVVPEALEGSIMLASHLLLSLGIPTHRILAKLRKIHTSRYEMLRGFFAGDHENIPPDEDDTNRRTLHSVVITEQAWAKYKSIQEISQIEQDLQIKSLTRQNQRYQPIPHNLILQEGDVLVVLATPEEIFRFETQLLIPQT